MEKCWVPDYPKKECISHPSGHYCKHNGHLRCTQDCIDFLAQPSCLSHTLHEQYCTLNDCHEYCKSLHSQDNNDLQKSCFVYCQFTPFKASSDYKYMYHCPHPALCSKNCQSALHCRFQSIKNPCHFPICQNPKDSYCMYQTLDNIWKYRTTFPTPDIDNQLYLQTFDNNNIPHCQNNTNLCRWTFSPHKNFTLLKQSLDKNSKCFVSKTNCCQHHPLCLLRSNSNIHV
jgi:hypothetical protein